MSTSDTDDAVRFATRIFDLLDRASTTSTYKYAVLLGLIDVVQSRVDADGEAPATVTTRELAVAVARLYWPQTRPFSDEVLRQNSSNQAKIVSRIETFRADHPYATSYHWAQVHRPKELGRLLDAIEWSLVAMPLPRLQRVGQTKLEFIYEIDWDESIDGSKRASGFSDYLAGRAAPDGGGFNNLIRLKPGVGAAILRLAPLLRPMIEREWARTVSAFNDLEFRALEEFLFRANRENLRGLVEPLEAAQEGLCFYCEAELGRRSEVDHFIPWSRCGNDGLYNLVLAHAACNRAKYNHIADLPHVASWVRRLDPESRRGARFDRSFRSVEWPRETEASVSIARSTYLNLGADLPLWRFGREFRQRDAAEIESVLKPLEGLDRMGVC